MDKRIQKKSKEREITSKRNPSNLKNQQNILQKDIIYCKNTIQNNNPNININISIKSDKKNKTVNRISSAHYTINSRLFKNINKSIDIKKLNEKNKNNYYTNIGIYNKTSNSNSKKKSLKAYLINPTRNSKSNPKMNSSKKNSNKLKKINLNNLKFQKVKKYGNNQIIEKIIRNKYEPKNNLFEEDLTIMTEYENLKNIWRELGITSNFVYNFEYMNNNHNNDKDEILQIIKAEKKQMFQFKNDFMRVLKEIEKREEEIKNIKILDEKYSNLRIFYNFENESDVKNKLDNKNFMSKEEIEQNIYKCLSSLRIKGINTVSIIKKFKMKYSYLINIGKIDVNYLSEVYGYNKNYIIKLLNDLNFLKDTNNIKEIYYFSPKGEDPFLLSLTGEKDLISNYKYKENELEKQYENEFEDLDGDNKRYNNYESKPENVNYVLINGKKYKTLPISKELLGIVKKLIYYLNQEKLFHMVKFGENSLNNQEIYNNEYSSYKDINQINNQNKNLTIDEEMKEKNIFNRSRAIVKLKTSNNNQYNQLFFNKTLNYNKSNNTDKGILFRTEKGNANINKNPIKLQKDIIISKNKEIININKKREIKINDNNLNEGENNEKLISKEKNYILKMFNKKEEKDKEKDKQSENQDEDNKPKLASNEEIKRLIIRTKDNDYSSNNNTKRRNEEFEKATLLRREEEIYNEVEKRVKLEVDKKMKSIEEAISLKFKKKMEADRERLEKETKKIEEEKKKIKKYHEEQENRRKEEEIRRQKEDEDRRAKEEKEKKEKIEKERKMKEENEKLKKDLEEKFRKEIEERFKKNQEIQEIKEKQEKIRRENEEKERKKREEKEKKRNEEEKKRWEELMIKIRKEETERLREEEREKIREEEIEKIRREGINLFIKEENDRKMMKKVEEEFDEKEKERIKERNKQWKKEKKKEERRKKKNEEKTKKKFEKIRKRQIMKFQGERIEESDEESEEKESEEKEEEESEEEKEEEREKDEKDKKKNRRN